MSAPLPPRGWYVTRYWPNDARPVGKRIETVYVHHNEPLPSALGCLAYATDHDRIRSVRKCLIAHRDAMKESR